MTMTRMMMMGVCLLAGIMAAQARFICYQGSSLYQVQWTDCSDVDGNYTGTWYCSRVDICEWGISSDRECATTRSCSKENDCKDSNGNVYTGHNPVTLGGTRVTTSCCQATKFDDDDAIAIDLSDICNSAISLQSNIGVVVASAVVIAVATIFG